MKNQWHLRVFTKFDDSFPFEREEEDEFYGISQSKIKIVFYIKIVKKGLEYVARELSVVLTKWKFPSSRNRTSYLRISTTLLQSSALPTELWKEGLWNFEFKGKTLFHENRWHLRVFTQFDESFPFERKQEDEFYGTSLKQN